MRSTFNKEQTMFLRAPRETQTRNLNRREVLGSAAGLVLAVGYSARSAYAQTTPATGPAEGAWSFTDDRGITVSLPERPERIVAQVTAAASLWDYGIRPVGVFGPQRRADGTPDPLAGDIDLDAVTSLGEAWGEFDLEQMIALHPDLLVSGWYGTYHGELTPLWYVPEEAAPVVHELTPSIGILMEDVSIAQTIDRFAELAAALGADLESPGIVADKERFDRAVADLKAAIAEKPGLTVLAMSGDADNYYVAHPAAAADLIFLHQLGLDIVVPESDPEEYWDTLSWEQANKYPADVILQDNRPHALSREQLMAIPTWHDLPAVKAGQVIDWHLEPIYSYKGYAPVIEDLAASIREARENVV
jgi:iron complex transport system substrate-binding protein